MWRLFRRGFVREALLSLSCYVGTTDSESFAHCAKVAHRTNSVAREDLVAASAGNAGALGQAVDSEVQSLQTLLEYS